MIYGDYLSSYFFWSFENTILPSAGLSQKKSIFSKYLLILMVVHRTPWLGLISAIHKENEAITSKTVAFTNFKCSCFFLHSINLVP